MYIDIHSHSSNVEDNVLKLQNIFLQSDELGNTYFSAGLHPWHISGDYSLIVFKLKSLVGNSKLLAIGEAGLDKNVVIPLTEQKRALEMQLHYSEKYKLPVILHIVKAYSDIIALRAENEYSQPWIVHGFVKSKELADQLIGKGFYLSLGASLMNENSSSVELIKNIDLSKVFFETDDNKDYSIVDIYRRAAQIRNIPLEDLIEQIENNFKKVFSSYDG